MVVFYTNDLAATPPKDTVYLFEGKGYSSMEDMKSAIKCVHGLGPMLRWTNENILSRNVFLVLK